MLLNHDLNIQSFSTAGKKGVCFMRYSKKTGCRKMGKFSGKKFSFEECCTNNGKGWSERKRNRKSCTPCVEVNVGKERRIY